MASPPYPAASRTTYKLQVDRGERLPQETKVIRIGKDLVVQLPDRQRSRDGPRIEMLA